METKGKRSAIINSTISAVAHHGFHGASVNVIAGHAGVAAGTVYVYFESKEHLMLETYRELERCCLAAVMKEYPSQGSIRQRFSHLAHRLIRHFMLFPEEFLFINQFLSSPYRKSMSPHYQQGTELSAILQLFREGTEKQLLKEMSPAMLLSLACGPLIQVFRADAAGFFHLDDNWISRTVEACWDAVSLQKATYVRKGQNCARQSETTPEGPFHQERSFV